MHILRNLRLLIPIFIIAIILSACGNNNTDSDIESDNNFQSTTSEPTEIVATIMAESTQSPIPTATPIPSPTTDPELLVLAYTIVTANHDWTPVEQTIDGVEMVLVPVGCFSMGYATEQIDYALDTLEGPITAFPRTPNAHEVCFDKPFWIDKYEVTNSAYGEVSRCLDSSSLPNQPRNCITWTKALDYCIERGARLPTEAEWEYAARGPESWNFTWGNEFVEENVSCCGDINSQTVPVGTVLGDVSWVGALDMGGNIAEWTSSLFTGYPYDATDGREDLMDDYNQRIVRGGSFFKPPYAMFLQRRWPSRQGNGFAYYGIRCARSFN